MPEHDLQVGDLLLVPDEDGVWEHWRNQLTVVTGINETIDRVYLRRLSDGGTGNTSITNAIEWRTPQEEQSDA